MKMQSLKRIDMYVKMMLIVVILLLVKGQLFIFKVFGLILGKNVKKVKFIF